MFTIERQDNNEYKKYDNSFSTIHNAIAHILYLCPSGQYFIWYINTPLVKVINYGNNDFVVYFLDNNAQTEGYAYKK